MSQQPITRVHWAICALLAVTVAAIYWQTLTFKFTNYDDQTYVTENTHVQAGLTADGVKWAFTTLSGSNWHPLTWLSHMLDWQIYGNRPGLHHLTNGLIHLLNAILLFFILSRMTGSVWRSAFVAALFAVHPLHVESVAWVAERKDVLSALFWILTMGAYARYARSPSVKRYLPVLLLLALGLMAKPMLVTLPFALLLLDYWPLRRLKGNFWALLLEKMPLIALAAASSVVTYVAQQKGGSVAALQALPLDRRVSNAIISYVTYMGRMFWPLHLAVFYPSSHEAFQVRLVAGAAFILVALTAFAILQRKKQPYVAVGWLWYVGTLVPVIGLVQVGEQATADRYTYIPLIGLFLAIAWLAPALIPRTKRRWRKSESDAAATGTKEIVLAGTAVAVVLALTVAARVQAGYWRDSIALFSHALAVTTDNEVAHNNLGLALADDGRTKEAAQQYQEALKVSPTDPDANYNFGLALAGQRRYEQAAEHYRISLKSRPNSPKALDSLGTALAMLGHPDRAIDCYRKSLELDSDNARAHNNLANALFKQGQLDESVLEYRAALRLKPDLKEAHSNLSIALFYKGDYAGAWREAHLARKYGASPRPGFLNALSWKMPEPAGD
jgi:tetratricopeptide (TPR) repeat protein